jgi:hypothetical protein
VLAFAFGVFLAPHGTGAGLVPDRPDRCLCDGDNLARAAAPVTAAALRTGTGSYQLVLIIVALCALTAAAETS